MTIGEEDDPNMSTTASTSAFVKLDELIAVVMLVMMTKTMAILVCDGSDKNGDGSDL